MVSGDHETIKPCKSRIAFYTSSRGIHCRISLLFNQKSDRLGERTPWTCLENNRDVLGPLDQICQPTCSHATYTIVGSSSMYVQYIWQAVLLTNPPFFNIWFWYASFRWTRIYLHTIHSSDSLSSVLASPLCCHLSRSWDLRSEVCPLYSLVQHPPILLEHSFSFMVTHRARV